jgi:sugar lactone lactonase YvrE
VDPAGSIYVADREQGAVLRLDAAGRVLDPRWVTVRRPRTLAADGQGRIWIGADGEAEAPWQAGPGEIWWAAADGTAQLVLRGPVAAGLAMSPAGHPFVADRAKAALFAVSPEGTRVDVATFTDGDAPRSLAFAPDTPATRQAGVAGDLFLVLIRRGAWPVNDVVRISGPFDELVRRGQVATP